MKSNYHKVYPTTEDGSTVYVNNALSFDSYINKIPKIEQILKMVDSSYQYTKEYNELLDKFTMYTNVTNLKLQFESTHGYGLCISQIPTLCGGGILEHVNNLQGTIKENVEILHNILKYINHCRYCYTSKYNLTYYKSNDEVKSILKLKEGGFMADSWFGFTFLQCNLNTGTTGELNPKADKALQKVGFKLVEQTKNIKTGNIINHYTINIEEYVKTQQSTKSSKSKKAELIENI